MAKKLLLIALAFGLVAGIVVYYTGDRQEAGSPSADSSTGNLPDNQLALETGNQTGLPAGKTTRRNAATNVREAVKQQREAYTALAQKLSAPENTPKRDAFIDKAHARLEIISNELMQALQGDDKAARKLLTRSRECRQFSPMTPIDVETEIAYYQSRFDRKSNRTDQQIEQKEKQIKQMRTAMTRRVETCSWRHTGEFPTLRDQVERQAEVGNVLARFYYAMLFKPSPYEVDYLLETAAWSDNSLRFTMENINQGMTLGYLALSFSHAQGIFTHQDARLAGIWSYLVMTCPMNGPIAAPYLNTLLSNERMEFLSATTVDIGQVWALQVCP